MRTLTICFLFFLVTRVAFTQECSHLWYGLYSADPLQPKGMSGDTAAVYGVFSFASDSNLRLVVRDQFPKARFMSFQTYHGKLTLKGDYIPDYLIQPESGDTYSLEFLPEGSERQLDNSLFVKTKRGEIQSIMYRVYVPTGVKELRQEDMPKIFAYDLRTGAERSCPKLKELPLYLNLPQALVAGTKRQPEFEFGRADVGFGPNSAIPYYVYAKTKMDRDDIAIIRFKAPTLSEVRYWSLCANNITKNQTLNCVPDYEFEKVAGSGNDVTILFGGGEKARLYAESRGYLYLPDTRKPDQKVVLFAYRNILPEPDFAETRMYREDYLPHGNLVKVDELSKY